MNALQTEKRKIKKDLSGTVARRYDAVTGRFGTVADAKALGRGEIAHHRDPASLLLSNGGPDVSLAVKGQWAKKERERDTEGERGESAQRMIRSASRT